MKKRGIAQKIKYLGIGITLFIQTVYGTGATVNAENLVSTESLIEESESDSYFSYNIKDVISLSAEEIFGKTTYNSEIKTTVSDWNYMITNDSVGRVDSDGVDGLKTAYIIDVGEVDMTDVTSITVERGLNTERVIKGKIEADCELQNMDCLTENDYFENNTDNFMVYSGGVWDYVLDGTLLNEFRCEGVSSNWEKADYIYEITDELEGIHEIYYRVYAVMNTWAGGLYSITFNKTSEVINGSNISITEIYKDGDILESIPENLNVEEDTIIWDTNGMSNAEAGDYTVMLQALNSDGDEITKELHITVNSMRDYTHPGLLFTKSQLESIASNYYQGIEPFKSAVDELLQSANANYELQGYEKVIEEGNTIWCDTKSVQTDNHGFNNDFRNDCMMAYNNALAFGITNDEAYAENAIMILNAYSKLKPEIDGHDHEFVAGQMAFRLCNAAEILRYCYLDSNGDQVWSENDVNSFENWMLVKFVQHIDTYGMANGGACGIKGMLAIGIFCENDTIYNYAINGYMNDENCGVTGLINEFGQNRECGRDQTHSQLILGHLSEFAWVAYNQDSDLKLFEYANNRLLKGYEYMAAYMLGEEVEYDNSFYSTNYTYSAVISETNQGMLLPCYELVYNYYVGIKGWDKTQLPYTSQAVVFTRNEGTVCYNGGYDSYHLIGYGTLTGAQNSCPAQLTDDSFSITALPGGQVEIVFDSIPEGCGINIYRSNSDLGDVTEPTAYPVAFYTKVNDEIVCSARYVDKGLIAGNNYFYKMSVVDGNGNESGCCEAVYVTACKEAPANAPSYVHTYAVNDDIFKISWDKVSGAAGYDLYVAVNGGEYQKLNTESITDTYCYHLGLMPDTQYQYKVIAVNDYGQSDLSEATGIRTSSNSATGTNIGSIGKLSRTVKLYINDDVSISSDGSYEAGEDNNCINSSKVSYLKVDLSDFVLLSGEVFDDARLFFYRCGSTSPASVEYIESEKTDYDNWSETKAEDGVTLSNFTIGNLSYEIDEGSVHEIDSYVAKPASNKSYNSSDQKGVNILNAVTNEFSNDKVLTMRVNAIGTGGSNSLSFYSSNSDSDYRPFVTLSISNPVLIAYENTDHEYVEEEQANNSTEENSGAGKSDQNDDIDDKSGAENSSQDDGSSLESNQDENNSSETSSNNDTAIETKDDIGVQDDSEDSSTMTAVIIQKVVESIQRTVTSIIKKIFGWFR